MSRVNVDAQAFVDSRFGMLAKLMGWEHTETSIGFMARIWLECTLRETDILTEAELNCASPAASGAVGDQLACVNLAEKLDDGRYRIKGCVGRTDWLEKKRRAGKKGGESKGKPQQAKAKRASKQKTKALRQKTNTPAPVPALTPTDNPQTPKGDVEIVVDYLNSQLGRTGASCFRAEGNTRKLIEERLADGHTARELRMVCWHKHREWNEKEDMAQFLRPSTLFRKSKFEEYLPSAQAEIAAQERDKPDPHKVSREDYKPLLGGVGS